MDCLVPNLTRGASPYALIENVVTHRRYRQQGVATRLLEHALSITWERRCYKVMLLSSVYRGEAHALYEKVGFSREAKIGYVIKAPGDR